MIDGWKTIVRHHGFIVSLNSAFFAQGWSWELVPVMARVQLFQRLTLANIFQILEGSELMVMLSETPMVRSMIVKEYLP